MRLSVLLLAGGAAVFLGGAWLVGMVVFGVAVMAVGVGMVTLGLLRDDGRSGDVAEMSPRERWRRSA